MDNLRGHPERGKVSTGGSEFGEIWMLSENGRERIVAKLPVAVPIVRPDKCEDIGLEKEYHELLEKQVVVYGRESVPGVSELCETFVAGSDMFMVVYVMLCYITRSPVPE